MSDFFDRMVARASGGGRGAVALEPRTASRYASPEQQLGLAEATPGADASASLEEAPGPAEIEMPGLAASARDPRFDSGAGDARAPEGGATDARDDHAWRVRSEARPALGMRGVAEPSGEQASGDRRPPSGSPAAGARDPLDAARALTPVLDRWNGGEPGGFETYAPDPGDGATRVPPPPRADAAAAPPQDATQDATKDTTKDAATSSAPFSTEDAFWSFLYPSASASVSASASASASGVTAAAPDGESGTAPWARIAARTGAMLGPAFAGGARTAGHDPDDAAPEAPEITVSIERIDVRGLAPPPARPSAPARRGPRLGLQEYMQKSGPARSGGSGR